MEQALRDIQGIIFELDSVLFDKADWVFPAVEFAAGQMRIDPQRALALAHEYVAKHGGADPQIYNHVLLGCGQFDTAMNIRAFTSLVNQFQPKSRSIQLYPGVEEALLSLRDQFKLAVVTDGAPDTQKRKVIALGLQELIPLIVYSDEIEGIKSRLPDPRPLLRATGDMRLRPEQVLFVGHNPIKHFMRTGEMGFKTVRVLSGEYGRQDYMSEDHRANYDLPSAARLVELLSSDYVPPVESKAEWGTEKSWPTPELAAPPDWTPEAIPSGTSFEDAAFQALFQMTDPSRLETAPVVSSAPPAPQPPSELRDPLAPSPILDTPLEAAPVAPLAVWPEPVTEVVQELAAGLDGDPVEQLHPHDSLAGVWDGSARQADDQTPLTPDVAPADSFTAIPSSNDFSGLDQGSAPTSPIEAPAIEAAPQVLAPAPAVTQAPTTLAADVPEGDIFQAATTAPHVLNELRDAVSYADSPTPVEPQTSQAAVSSAEQHLLAPDILGATETAAVPVSSAPGSFWEANLGARELAHTPVIPDVEPQPAAANAAGSFPPATFFPPAEPVNVAEPAAPANGNHRELPTLEQQVAARAAAAPVVTKAEDPDSPVVLDFSTM